MNLALMALLIAGAATVADPQADQPSLKSSNRLILAGVQYGAPMRTSASVALFMSRSLNKTYPRIEGWLVEAGAGQGGGRISVGHAGFLEYLGLDLRGVLSRTWNSPRAATPKATYGGLEAGMTILYVRVSAGVARRLAGPAGDHATIFTWSGAIQIPIK
ncbi:MAG: hypothetical protein EPO35_10375 [Acidobacteria bacterium]|nr:MAG: hypothetical protein EPO35_10375 [Acidobacteriota bacterium]